MAIYTFSIKVPNTCLWVKALGLTCLVRMGRSGGGWREEGGGVEEWQRRKGGKVVGWSSDGEGEARGGEEGGERGGGWKREVVGGRKWYWTQLLHSLHHTVHKVVEKKVTYMPTTLITWPQRWNKWKPCLYPLYFYWDSADTAFTMFKGMQFSLMINSSTEFCERVAVNNNIFINQYFRFHSRH